MIYFRFKLNLSYTTTYILTKIKSLLSIDILSTSNEFIGPSCFSVKYGLVFGCKVSKFNSNALKLIPYSLILFKTNLLFLAWSLLQNWLIFFWSVSTWKGLPSSYVHFLFCEESVLILIHSQNTLVILTILVFSHKPKWAE